MFLQLSKTAITDAGLRDLSGMRSLRGLYLDNTKITDAGLQHVFQLRDLEVLGVDSTNVTEGGRSALLGPLPKLKFHSLKTGP